jgi:hypothetical protein
MIETLKIATANVVFWFGYYWYKTFNKTPWYSYLMLRKLFYTSNTQFNKRLSEKIAKENSIYSNLSPSGVLGNLSATELDNISRQLQANGYYVFPATLDEKTINYLTELSFRTKAKLIPKPKDGEEFGLFKRSEPKAIKYQFFESDLVQDPEIQKLISDKSIVAVAQSFLKSKPVLDLISMWWSTAVSSKASSEVAQLYHWDMERIKFLKFFFYLTDVDTNTGPHCYVKGSNNGFPEPVRRDGRIMDEEISKAYPPENILEIVGKRGSILAVDTSGFHKGKNLKNGDRLLLQFEFANSLFGINSEYFDIEQATPEFKEAHRTYPFIFQRYNIKQ